MNYFELCTNILNNAGKHKFVKEVYYGDVYEFNNLPNRRYPNFVLTASGSSVSGDITTYSFSAFTTDRLVDDKSNTLEVQSECKTILEQIFANGFTGLDNISYTVWTEKFNDLCAGCYASFNISLPNELICADDDLFDRVVKEINANGEYSVDGFDTVKVSVLPTTEAKTLTVTENGSYEVLPTEAAALSKVEVSVDVWNKFSPTSINWQNQKTLTEIPNIRALDTSNVTNMGYMFYNCQSLKELDVSGWDTSKCIAMGAMFYGNSSLKELDVSGWDTSKVTSVNYSFHSCTSLKTVIGNHTLADVEAGDIVALKDCGQACTDLQYNGAPNLRYSSMLALANGAYDRSSTTAATFRLSTTAFNYCRNDDDTIPDADTIAERQAKIRAICAEKNYNLVLG